MTASFASIYPWPTRSDRTLTLSFNAHTTASLYPAVMAHTLTHVTLLSQINQLYEKETSQYVSQSETFRLGVCESPRGHVTALHG